MFSKVNDLQECLEQALGPVGSPDSLIGTFEDGTPAIWVNWKQAPKRGKKGLHVYIEPVPDPGSKVHHNWIVTIYSIGETATAGKALLQAFERMQEVLPVAMHTHRSYTEQGFQGLVFSIPNHLSNGNNYG